MATNQIIPQFSEQAFGSGAVSNATATATAPAVANQTFFMTGLDVTTAPPTNAASVLLTVSGLKNGSLLATVGIANTAPALPNNIFQVRQANPIPASASNTAVVATLPTIGAGGTGTIVTLYGYYAP